MFFNYICSFFCFLFQAAYYAAKPVVLQQQLEKLDLEPEKVSEAFCPLILVRVSVAERFSLGPVIPGSTLARANWGPS